VSEDLDIHVEEQPQGIVVRLKGTAGIAGAQSLDRALTSLLARRPRLVVMDLCEVQAMASLAMGQLVAAQRAIVRAGGKMRLAAVQPMVLSSLTHARLDTVFQFYPSVADALATAV